MKREELINQLMEQYQTSFKTFNGFDMNRRQKKELLKRIEKTVDRKLKNL